MYLTTLELCSISNEISANRPIWALLRANEYLSSTDSLHKALVKRATDIFQRNSRYGEVTELISHLSAGYRLADLPEDLQQQARKFKEPSPKRKRLHDYIPHNRLSFQERRSRLQMVEKAAGIKYSRL